MKLTGKLVAETPLYRGNARKTLFTRDGDGKQRLVSLAGEISGTAQSLMDAFIGASRDGRNTGLLNQAWLNLYDDPMPGELIRQIDCQLQSGSYPRNRFFDLRMGLKLDEDRWSSEANANYKMETIFRNAVFDFVMDVNDSVLGRGNNRARLHHLLQEMEAGRFWFGAGKSKGLGRVRLELDTPLAAPSASSTQAATPPQLDPRANHLRIALEFNAANPVLVGWNWGKVDPDTPSFAVVEGRMLLEAMRDLPAYVRTPLEMVLGGPILSAEDWKAKFALYLPRTAAIWLQKQSVGTVEVWTLSVDALERLGKGKYGLSAKLIDAVRPLCDQPFESEEAAASAISEVLGKKDNMTGRIVKVMEHQTQESSDLNQKVWQELAWDLGLDPALESQIAAQVGDEAGLTAVMSTALAGVLPRLNQQVDQQINLLQSDAWVDVEIASREEHLRIKTMLLDGRIDERQWGDRRQTPSGVSASAWQTFVDEHQRVRYQHMIHPRNLGKSIANDQNFVAYLKIHRDRARQELAQSYNVDYRAGGAFNRSVSRKYGKSYDTVFMRMLSWSPSEQELGAWEIYVPGSTLKGAFRKRASQVLKTLWGESRRTDALLDRFFGAQGRRGMVFFSDAYLRDPLDPARAWSSMDGVRMDPRTGQPEESAKQDFLYAYGAQLIFRFRLDIQNVEESDREALSILAHLLQDFQRGDVPVGGEKTSGFGWVCGEIDEIEWLSATTTGITQTLFGTQAMDREGIWHRLILQDQAAAEGIRNFMQPLGGSPTNPAQPPRASTGFVSHRSFGGHSGSLAFEVEVLTPTHIRESGEPSFQSTLNDQPVNGWDFFSMSPPTAEMRSAARQYALPSRSLKGMVRHLYTIASDSGNESRDLGSLNPADSLFGWVGRGTNQSIMGRLSFGFAAFDAPELAWYTVPFPYSGWVFEGGQWRQASGRRVPQLRIADAWRLFPHTPLAPIAQRSGEFQPNSAQASHFRAILPGSTARFTLRFWNLDEAELRRLLWCTTLGADLAHKIGHHRYLGFGALRLRLLPESFLIDWPKRYAGRPEDEWRLPVDGLAAADAKVIAYYAELQKALNANAL